MQQSLFAASCMEHTTDNAVPCRAPFWRRCGARRQQPAASQPAAEQRGAAFTKPSAAHLLPPRRVSFQQQGDVEVNALVVQPLRHGKGMCRLQRVLGLDGSPTCAAFRTWQLPRPLPPQHMHAQGSLCTRALPRPQPDL